MPKVQHDPPRKVFEDFHEGEVLATRGRTVDTSDFTVFAGLTGDHYPLHTDEMYAETTKFGERIGHGPLTFTLAIGLVGLTNWYGDAIVAMVEVDRLRAKRPVLAGDTIRVRAEVVGHEVDPERPKYGMLRVLYRVFNQRDEEVMDFVQSMLARRRDEQEESNDA